MFSLAQKEGDFISSDMPFHSQLLCLTQWMSCCSWNCQRSISNSKIIRIFFFKSLISSTVIDTGEPMSRQSTQWQTFKLPATQSGLYSAKLILRSQLKQTIPYQCQHEKVILKTEIVRIYYTSILILNKPETPWADRQKNKRPHMLTQDNQSPVICHHTKLVLQLKAYFVFLKFFNILVKGRNYKLQQTTTN